MNAPDADAPLVERVKQGDVKAFEMLVVKYQRRIERLIGRMVRDVDLVPDIAQETFIRAYRALPQFRGDSTGGAGLWLPVQRRRGLESQWHALRCAVYAPPAVVDVSPAFGSAPASRSSLE